MIETRVYTFVQSFVVQSTLFLVTMSRDQRRDGYILGGLPWLVFFLGLNLKV